MTPCRGCGQSIIFIPKPDGGWMPCEPEPIDWAELEENEMAVHQSGKVYRVSPERNDPENGEVTTSLTGRIAHRLPLLERKNNDEEERPGDGVS